MKYNINKFQQGGGFATFTPITYTQPAASSGPTPSKTSSKKSISSVLDDETFKELINKGGLTNDVNNLVNELMKIEASSNSETPYSQSNNRLSAIRMIGKINELKETKEAWKDAFQTSKQEGGLNEVAVDSSGLMYTKDEDGKVKQITAEGYAKSNGTAKVLTVAELLNERQYNPQLVGQNSIFDVADNAIGLNKITDHIKTVIGSLSKETLSDTRHYSKDQIAEKLASFTGKKPTADELEAVQKLSELANTPGEFFKVMTENTTQRKYASKALDYIWKTLGQSAQQKLTATAAINGQSNPKAFIADMLISQTDETSRSIITPEREPGTTGTSSAKGEKNLTTFQMFHKDKLATPNLTFAVNDPKVGMLFRGVIGGVAPVMLPNGANVGMATVNRILQSGYNQILKGNDVYFGNKKVDTAQLNNVIYDGQDAAKVYMPVGSNGQPDYDSLAEFKNIYSVYEANKDKWSVGQAEKHFADHGYKIKIDEKYEDGRRIKVIRDNAQVKPFLVMYGYTNDATPLVDGNENWITKLSSQEEDAIVPQLEQIWTVGKNSKTTKAKNMTPSAFWNIEEYYKGIIAIPYRDESSAIVDSMVHQGPTEKPSSILDVQRNLNFSSNQSLNPDTSVLSLKN